MQLKQLVALVLLPVALSGLPAITNAQGWGFSFQITTSGPCYGDIPAIPSFNIPNGIPNKSQCESLRQTILDIKVSGAVYDEHGNYIGDCSVFYTCTPCTGSDIVTTSNGSSGPGSVSVNGLTQGTAFFSPHESEAIQNWIDDYMEKMKAMGWDINAANTPTLQDVPLTGDLNFDKYYFDQVMRFEKPEQGGVVDLKGKQGIIDPNDLKTNVPAVSSEAATGLTVPIFRDPDEGKTDEFYRTHFSPVNPDNGIDGVYVGTVEQEPFWTTDQMTELAKAAVGIPLMFVEGALGYAAVPVVNLVFEDYKAAVQLSRLIDGENVNVPTTGQIFVNTGQSSVLDIGGKVLDEFGIGKIVGTKLGDEALYLYNHSPGVAGTALTAWGIYGAGKKK